MNPRRDLDALIESTMAFVKNVTGKSIPEMPIAVETAEQALADNSKPVQTRAPVSPMVLPASERDEFLQRIANFKAHQHKFAREREDYYLLAKARMLATLGRRPES